MHIPKKDIFTPANAVSVIGLFLTIYGALNIQSLHGVLLLGLGRFIDIFDGKVARATHTSRFGAALDAFCDKIGIIFLVTAVWVADIAPYWLLVYIIIQNILNAVLSLATNKRGTETTASKNGKYAMFLQNISLGCFALASVTPLSGFVPVGYAIGIFSMYWAYRATVGYYRDYSRSKAA